LGAEVVACCNRSEAGRRRAVEEGKIETVYDNIPEMLHAERPDGVICCASLDQVYHAAKRILPFSLPTLLEKPPGTSLTQYNDLCQLAKRHCTPVMVGLNRTYYSVIQRAVADLGGIDKITAVFVEWSEDPRHCLERGLTPEQVQRMIFGNSLHGLHLLTTLAGDFLNPQISTVNLGQPFRWTMALQGLSNRGVLGTFTSTWDSPGGWRLTVCVSRRRYVFAPLETCEVQTSGSSHRDRIEPERCDIDFKPGFYRQAQHFLQLIHTGKCDVANSLQATAPSMDLAELLTESSIATAIARPICPEHSV
jgi:predicted dehydrogenase